MLSAELDRRLRPDVVLTTFDRNDWVYEALRAGASGFLLKAVRASQLTDAIRTVAAGETMPAPSITGRFIEDYLARHGTPGPDPKAAALSEREREVLRRIALGQPTPRSPGRSFSAFRR